MKMEAGIVVVICRGLAAQLSRSVRKARAIEDSVVAHCKHTRHVCDVQCGAMTLCKISTKTGTL